MKIAASALLSGVIFLSPAFAQHSAPSVPPTAEQPEILHGKRAAAEQGDAPAQYELRRAYRDGLGVPRDDSTAIAWFRKGLTRVILTHNSGLASCTP